LDATHRIRELEESGAFGAYSVPIVAVSGNARDEWTKRAQHSGMDGRCCVSLLVLICSADSML
jgi:hypothetical protein